MLTPNELNVFLAAAEAHSFSGAARKLYLSQPAVSQQIQALERRLRIELFERRGGRIVLTEAGATLLPLARELVNLSLHVEESMAAYRGVVTGRLQIGCTTTPGKYILPLLAGSFCEIYPEVHVGVEVTKRSDLVARLQRQEINFGIMSGKVDNPELLFDELMEDQLVLIVSSGHPLAVDGPVSLDQLRGQTIILREELSGTRISMLEGLEQAGLSPTDLKVASVELGAAEGVIAAVEAGWGISWVSRIAARRAVEMGGISIVEVEGLRMHRTVYIVSHRSRVQTNAHRKFCEYVRSPEARALVDRQGGGSHADSTTYALAPMGSIQRDDRVGSG